MTVLNPKSLPGDHDRITWDAHQGHETRLVRLEEFRGYHEELHRDHVATREFVYRTVAWIAGVIAAAAVAISRLIASGGGAG